MILYRVALLRWSRRKGKYKKTGLYVQLPQRRLITSHQDAAAIYYTEKDAAEARNAMEGAESDPDIIYFVETFYSKL